MKENAHTSKRYQRGFEPGLSRLRVRHSTTEPPRSMMDSEVLFRRLLAVSKQRDVNLEQVLSHELAPVPPSLFNDEGTMRKTTKADLANKLESNCDEIQVLAVSHDNRTA